MTHQDSSQVKVGENPHTRTILKVIKDPKEVARLTALHLEKGGSNYFVDRFEFNIPVNETETLECFGYKSK